MTITIKDFCVKHDACKEGLEWAVDTGCTTMEELWKRDDIRPYWRVWIATRRCVLDSKDLRLFACWCVRQVWHLLQDDRSRHAVEVAERYAHGEATSDELATARVAAVAAEDEAREAALAASRGAAGYDALDAAGEAARAAAEDAWAVEDARAAAGRTAGVDAWYAAREAARSAAGAVGTELASLDAEESAKAAQAEYLRKLQPNFSKGS